MELGFVVGAMVAATDPVAVVSTFKQLGSPRRLATLIESESLFNDGTALVVVHGRGPGRRSGRSTPVDAVVSVVTIIVVEHRDRARDRLGRVAADRRRSTTTSIELTLSVAAAYGTYLVADLLAPVRDHRDGRRRAARSATTPGASG